MGYLGGKVGPDLTRIGGVRTERDLLEAIVFPSASFVRSYEPVKVTTPRRPGVPGRPQGGHPRRGGADDERHRGGARRPQGRRRGDPGTVSVMPSGLDQQLTKQELADLIAFLKARNEGEQVAAAGWVSP